MQGEFADLGQHGLLTSLELPGEIARMAAQKLGALGDEVVAPLLDLGESQCVLSSGLRGGGLALADVDDEGCLALGDPALWAVGIGFDLSGRWCGACFRLAYGVELQVEGGNGGWGDRTDSLLRLGCVLVSLCSTRPALRLHRASALGEGVPGLGSVRKAYHPSNPRGGRSRTEPSRSMRGRKERRGAGNSKLKTDPVTHQ
jgi:hypothetical protein